MWRGSSPPNSSNRVIDYTVARRGTRLYLEVSSFEMEPQQKMADDVAPSGTLVRASALPSVAVARFEELPGASGGRVLQPDLASAQLPLRLRSLPPAVPERAPRPGAPPLPKQETLGLQDASGKHCFVAERQNLDSHYSA